MTSKNLFSIGALSIAVIILSGCTQNNNNTTPAVTYSTVEWCITTKDNNKICKTDEIVAGETAEDSLQDVDEASDEITIEMQDSEFGAFVTTVNGYKPDINSEFWLFTINGNSATTGVSDTKTTNGDKYEIKLDTFDPTL